MFDSKRAFILFALTAAAAAPLPAEEPAAAEEVVIPALSIDSEGSVGVGTEAPRGAFNVTSRRPGVDPIRDQYGINCPGPTAWYDENHNRQADGGECRVTALIVTAAGNVGIGTALPAASLHVEGDVRVEGTLQLGDMALWQETSPPETPCERQCGSGVCLAAYVNTDRYSCEATLDTQEKTCLCVGLRR